MEPVQAAEAFLTETQFHLGFLPTEQSHPATRTLGPDFIRDTAAGLRTLQRPDRDVLAMASRVLASDEFARMVDTGRRVVDGGGRIVFSGCGATGRLSILLESMWRAHAARGGEAPADAVASLMTGGDFALIRSVESFEDHAAFGARQVVDLGLGPRDMLVAITEGGETSSVLGSAMEAARRGLAVHLLFNNPADLLRERLARCREALDDPRIAPLDLSCGPMALAGSTRMQATTAEQLVAGAFLESVLAARSGRPPADFAADFARTLDWFAADATVAQLAGMVDFEADVYARGGKITYLADDYLLDIFTDTTERSPTFMLPPFRPDGDEGPMSWAFVKNPLFDTRATWRRMLGRAPRCLAWKSGDYRAMGGDPPLAARPPRLDADELYRYEIGNEPAPERFADAASRAVAVTVAGTTERAALEAAARAYPVGYRLHIDPEASESPLRLQRHLALKLALNAVSTGTMAKLGRVSGNWMSWVGVSNKKLVDRAVRLVSELGGVDYRAACRALFEAMAEVESASGAAGEKPSPVQCALRRLKLGREESRRDRAGQR